MIRMLRKWRTWKLEVLSDPQRHPYTYTLKSGAPCQTMATITTKRATLVRCWWPFWWADQWIEAEFDDRLVENTGLCNGGYLGCTCSMRPGETPLQTLRRMESQDKFG